MPFGTIEDTYRITTTILQNESALLPQGDSISIDVSGTITTWYAFGHPTPIVVIRETEANNMGTISTNESLIYYGNFEFVGTDDVEVVADLNLFPNPASSEVTLSFTKKNTRPLDIEITDIQGKTYIRKEAIHPGNGSFTGQLQLEGLPSGFYILHIHSANKTQMRKLVVQ
jgi:hypothetical protein